jgi:hypothetical protein
MFGFLGLEIPFGTLVLLVVMYLPSLIALGQLRGRRLNDTATAL